MQRTLITRVARLGLQSTNRSFSVAAIRRAEGDTGGVRSGGTSQSDAYKRREDAAESLYIREKEREALKKLKEKLAAQEGHLKELRDHIEDLEKSK